MNRPFKARTIRSLVVVFCVLPLLGCRLLLVNGERWDHASAEIAAHPNSPEGYFERAEQNHQAWQWADVVLDVTKGLEVGDKPDPRCPAPDATAARSWVHPSNHSDCTTAPEGQPGCACYWLRGSLGQARLLRGHAYFKLGSLHDAEVDFAAAKAEISVRIAHDYLVGQEQWGKALVWFEELYWELARRATSPEQKSGYEELANEATNHRIRIEMAVQARAEADQRRDDAKVAKELAERKKHAGATACPVCSGKGTVLNYDPGTGTNCSTSYSHETGLLTNNCSQGRASAWSSKPCSNCRGTGQVSAEDSN